MIFVRILVYVDALGESNVVIDFNDVSMDKALFITSLYLDVSGL